MTQNRFVWYELMTTDIDSALSFYGALLGWEAHEFSGGEDRYVIVNAQGAGVGGVMKLPAGMGQPFWLGYVGTPDIDAAAASFVAAGGTLHRGPWEIPNVGRLALLGDPQGAGIAMIQGASEQPSQAFDQMKPGHGNWHELHTSDAGAALRFYTSQFGWGAGEAMDMGPMGIYQILLLGETQFGGIMKADAGMQPMWLYYFGVRSIAAAVKTITGAGGTVLHEPREVPGGSLIIAAKDPQGAMFALVGPG